MQMNIKINVVQHKSNAAEWVSFGGIVTINVYHVALGDNITLNLYVNNSQEEILFLFSWVYLGIYIASTSSPRYHTLIHTP